MSMDRRALIAGLVASLLAARSTWAEQIAPPGDPEPGPPRGLGAELAPAWVPAGENAFYIDHHGLIVQADGDGGDTAQREGFVWFGLWLLARQGIELELDVGHEWSRAIAQLEIGASGLFRRHPNPDEKWSDPKRFSRDQQTPIVAALGALGPRPVLDRLWRAFEDRGRTCQNGDAGGFDHQNLFFRARGAGTIESLGEALLAAMVPTLFMRGQADWADVGDDLNFLVQLAAAKTWRPTSTSTEALRQYLVSRPRNYGCYFETLRREQPGVLGRDSMKTAIDRGVGRGWQPDCHPVVGALRWYFRPETGAGWGPALIWERVVEEVLED